MFPWTLMSPSTSSAGLTGAFRSAEYEATNKAIPISASTRLPRRSITSTCMSEVSRSRAMPSSVLFAWPQPRQRLDDQGESRRQVIPWPAKKPHLLALLAGDYPEAVVLDFDQPFRPRAAAALMSASLICSSAGVEAIRAGIMKGTLLDGSQRVEFWIGFSNFYPGCFAQNVFSFGPQCWWGMVKYPIINCPKEPIWIAQNNLREGLPIMLSEFQFRPHGAFRLVRHSISAKPTTSRPGCMGDGSRSKWAG
jgi:hypothetical protein